MKLACARRRIGRRPIAVAPKINYHHKNGYNYDDCNCIYYHILESIGGRDEKIDMDIDGIVGGGWRRNARTGASAGVGAGARFGGGGKRPKSDVAE